MKIAFWIFWVIVLCSEYYFLQGFINIYFKNYNGGPSSSSGSIIYPFIGCIVLLIAGLVFYFLGYTRVATLIMGLPVTVFFLQVLFRFLPFLLGGKMQ